jgi:hypothetical protein
MRRPPRCPGCRTTYPLLPAPRPRPRPCPPPPRRRQTVPPHLRTDLLRHPCPRRPIVPPGRRQHLPTSLRNHRLLRRLPSRLRRPSPRPLPLPPSLRRPTGRHRRSGCTLGRRHKRGRRWTKGSAWGDPKQGPRHVGARPFSVGSHGHGKGRCAATARSRHGMHCLHGRARKPDPSSREPLGRGVCTPRLSHLSIGRIRQPISACALRGSPHPRPLSPSGRGELSAVRSSTVALAQLLCWGRRTRDMKPERAAQLPSPLGGEGPGVRASLANSRRNFEF